MAAATTTRPARVIQASEAKTHFLRILDDVERGETVTITRHGKTVARIIPEVQSDPERIRAAIEQMREFRKQTGRMTLKEILSARDEGRM
jgi:prevent-host-death family protein